MVFFEHLVVDAQNGRLDQYSDQDLSEATALCHKAQLGGNATAAAVALSAIARETERRDKVRAEAVAKERHEESQDVSRRSLRVSYWAIGFSVVAVAVSAGQWWTSCRPGVATQSPVPAPVVDLGTIRDTFGISAPVAATNPAAASTNPGPAGALTNPPAANPLR